MTRYRIDPSRSRVWISARSSLHPIEVETDEVAGTFVLDEPDGASVLREARLAVAVASLTSGNPLVDRETRRRLDARRHPELVGELTRAAPGDDGRLRAQGRVTVRGVARDVSGALTVARDGDDGVVVEGSQRFDVRDWELAPPRLLGLRVEPEVRVRIRIRGRPAP